MIHGGEETRYRRAVSQLEGLQILGMRFGTERMGALLRELGEPQRSQPAIHVVGTNGKTSTTRFAAAALASQGLRVGAYTSPHVIDWTERIAVDGAAIDAKRFADVVEATFAAALRLGLAPDDQPTQFELITAAGFLAFAQAGVDAAVIEAGLGGRFDATNVLPIDAVRGATGRLNVRRVVALTNISLEHTEILGSTEAQIAAEKLAVAPDGFDGLVIGALSPVATVAVEDECDRRGLSGWWVGREVTVSQRDVSTPGARYTDLATAAEGAVQRENLAVAVAAAERLLQSPLADVPLRAAMRTVSVPGRLERFPGEPDVLVDGAHNPAGMEGLAAALRGQTVGAGQVVAVVSILDDKNAAAMVGALEGVVTTVVATRSSHPRALTPQAISSAVGGTLEVLTIDDPELALARARDMAGRDGLVVVCGSLYLIAGLRGVLAKGANDFG